MRIKPEYKLRDIAGEKVIILQGPGAADLTRLVSLNPTAERLYRQLEGADFNIGDAADLLVGYYDIDRETAARDAAAWAGSLAGFGIIEE